MSMIWTETGFVENDPWIFAVDTDEADGQEIAGEKDDDAGNRVLTLAEALEQGAERNGFAVRLQPADNPRDLAPLLDRIRLIAVSFPAFSDGRGFSQAVLLRDRLGYKGELRAVGNVLLDQVPLMLRTGFDSFEVAHAPTIERLRQNHLPGIDLHYQPSAITTKSTGGYSWRRFAGAKG